MYELIIQKCNKQHLFFVGKTIILFTNKRIYYLFHKIINYKIIQIGEFVLKKKKKKTN